MAKKLKRVHCDECGEDIRNDDEIALQSGKVWHIFCWATLKLSDDEDHRKLSHVLTSYRPDLCVE